MATTANRLYRYPSQNAEPDAAGDLQRLAEDVDADVKTIATDVAANKAKIIPAGTQAGAVTVTVANATSSGTAAVVFDKPFAAAPFVVATYAGTSGPASTSRRLQTRVSAVTANGFTAVLETADGSNVGASFPVSVHWVAVRP